jgi:transcriptional regulator with XRE-family HTH domain
MLSFSIMPRRKRLEPTPVSVTDIDIGKRIAARRTELGLTQVQLATNMGLIQSLVSAYERGVLRLNAEMLVRFTQVLGVSADYLLGVDQPEPEKAFALKFTKRMSGIKKLPESTQRHVLRMIDIYLAGEKDESKA